MWDFEKMQEIRNKYPDIINVKIEAYASVEKILHDSKITHIGFDIIDNHIVDFKWYFKTANDLVKEALNITLPRLEYSLSFKDCRPPLCWCTRPDFEPFPYIEHHKTASFLMEEMLMQEKAEWLFKIADQIQLSTKSARYPLIGCGASHDAKNRKKIQGIKLYYTFWQIKNWNDDFGRNDSSVSQKALHTILPQLSDPYFCNTCEKVTDLMIQNNNLLSMFALNLNSDNQMEKLYFVTDDKTWIKSVDAMHQEVFQSPLNCRFLSLFEEICAVGYRFEEIAYSVKNGNPMIKIYFMV